MRRLRSQKASGTPPDARHVAKRPSPLPITPLPKTIVIDSFSATGLAYTPHTDRNRNARKILLICYVVRGLCKKARVKPPQGPLGTTSVPSHVLDATRAIPLPQAQGHRGIPVLERRYYFLSAQPILSLPDPHRQNRSACLGSRHDPTCAREPTHIDRRLRY